MAAAMAQLAVLEEDATGLVVYVRGRSTVHASPDNGLLSRLVRCFSFPSRDPWRLAHGHVLQDTTLCASLMSLTLRCWPEDLAGSNS